MLSGNNNLENSYKKEDHNTQNSKRKYIQEEFEV